MNKIEKILAETKYHVDSEIEKHIPKKGQPQALFNACWDAIGSGGKRLRPALIAITCQAFGGKPVDTYPAGAALEIAHNFLLIHDDIEDSSLLRRGKPAIYLKYGLAQGINVGDYLFAKSFKVLASGYKRWGSDKFIKVYELLNEMFTVTAEGQALELESRIKNLNSANLFWYENMALKKTGYYTGGTPCAIGAVIAGASEKEINAVSDFGLAIGLAFQIQDDILNLISQNGKYGKDFAGDLEEGKRTLMVVHFLENAKEKDISFFNSSFAKKMGLKSKRRLISLMESYGSIDFAKSYASEKVKKAKLVLKKNVKNSSGLKKLDVIADFFIERGF